MPNVADFIKSRGILVGNRAVSRVRDIAQGQVQNLLGTQNPVSNKYATQNLTYPLNVEGDPQQGHYVIFFINQQQHASLDYNRESINTENERLLEDYNLRDNEVVGSNIITGFASPIATQLARNRALNRARNGQKLFDDENQEAIRRGQGNLTVQRPPTIRLQTAIALYMPPQVQVSYGSEYASTEIGTLAKVGVDAYDSGGAGLLDIASSFISGNVVDSKDPNVNNLRNKIQSRGSEVARALSLQAAENVPEIRGAAAIAALKSGKVFTPRLELVFTGISRRSFSYSFKFLPKSEKEAVIVDRIVKAFKFNMAANFAGAANSAFFLETPNTFDIQYEYKGTENRFLNKISTCVLKSMDVTYGGEQGYATFEQAQEKGYEGSPPPVSTAIELVFEELELITKDRIDEGY